MNIRQILTIWLFSIVISSAFIAWVVRYPLSDTITDPAEQTIPSAPIVVIGSSLMLYAVPGIGSGKESSLLGDGRDHVRLAISGISEAQSLRLLEKMLTQKVETVFLEANPFIFDFADQSNHLSVIFFLKQKSRAVAAKLNLILKRGSSPEAMTAEVSHLFNQFQGNLNQKKVYPLYLRPPRHLKKLEIIISSLKHKGIKVILIAPPRSLWRAQLIGDLSVKELERSYQNLAKQLDLALFQPEPFWGNENFIDGGHLNNVGRERFINELKVWWNKQE